jgi:hypothetical protein
MAQNAIKGALMTCTMGQGPPAQLTPIPMGPPVEIDGQPAGTIQDYKPMANIPTFGMCISLSNPQVAAATSAALGVLTPQPCIPATSTPWSPGAGKVTIYGQPALLQTDKCQCMWGGTISITNAGQTKTTST